MSLTEFQHFMVNAGRVTLAVRSDLTNRGVVRIAAAFCSPNDQFSRKKGRLIAEGRLRVGKELWTLTIDDSKALRPQLAKLLLDAALSKHPGLPQWAKI